MFRRSLFLALLLCLSLSACKKTVVLPCDDGCGGSSPPLPPPPPPSAPVAITVNPDSSGIYVGEGTQLSAVVTGPVGVLQAVTWSTLNPSVASVDATGKVTGIALGLARIVGKANADPSKADTVKVSVSRKPQVNGITISPATLVLRVGQKYTPEVKVFADPDISTEYECYSTNTLVVRVDIATCEITGRMVNPAGASSPVQVVAMSKGLHLVEGRLSAGMSVVVIP